MQTTTLALCKFMCILQPGVSRHRTSKYFLADASRREFLISSRHEFLISSLIAGCSSGALSSVLCAPLDLVRTRLQVSGPGRGLLPALRDATSDGFLGQALYNLSSPPTHQT